MITAKSDDPWQCLSLLRNTLLVGIGVRRSHEEAIVTLLDLLNSIGVVVANETK